MRSPRKPDPLAEVGLACETTADLLTYGQTIWATQNKLNETEESSRGQGLDGIIQSWWFNSEPPDEECVPVVATQIGPEWVIDLILSVCKINTIKLYITG